MNKILIFAVSILLLDGCSLLGLPQVKSEDMPSVVQSIADSSSAGCFWVGGRGGGGALPGMAAPLGGYGSGEFLFGRVNRDNTKLTIENGTCTIQSGENSR